MIRKTKETSKQPIKIALWCFLLFMLAFITPLGAHAESDLISIGGTFLENTYHLAAGSQLDALDSFIEVQNKSNQAITVSLSAKVQNGLALVFQQGSLSLSANAKIRIPIGIIVDQTMPTGNYPLTLEITTVSSSQSKTKDVLSSSLTVDDKTSEVSLHIVSPDQKPVEAMLHLSQMVNGKALGIRSVQTSSLTERLPFGDYRLLIEDSGHQKMFFFTVDSSSQTKSVVFETIMIPSLSVSTQLDPKTKKATAFDVFYVIENLNTEKSNIKLELSVYDDEIMIDLVDIEYIPTLSISKQQSTYRYVPQNPLKGNLTFTLSVSDLSGTILSNQVSQSLDLRDKTWNNLLNLLGIGLILAGLGSGLVIGSKQLKKRQTQPDKSILSPINSVNSELTLEKFSTPEIIKTLNQPVKVGSDLDTRIKSVSFEEFSVFGIGFTLTGDVVTESSLIIKGKVIGNITSGKRIIIEPGAVIVGNVTAHEISISGSVNGIVTSHHELSVEHSAKLIGSIHTPMLFVEKGAVLNCQITHHPKA